MFLGLAEEGSAAADFITDADAMADKDFIGFKILADALTTLKFVYKKAGQTEQVVFSYGTAIAVDTWYKVGFIYDPSATAAKKITAYVDNVEQTTYVTSTNLAAATFPLGEEMSPIFGVKNSAATAKKLKLDWYALLQQFAD